MSNVQRRHFLAAAAAMAALPPVLADTGFPRRPLRIIVPLQAGGSADIGARLIALALQQQLGQPVIVENKPGGSFVIGMQALAKAPADGHTLIAVNTGMMAAQVSLGRYDMFKSLQPVSQYGTTPTLFVVPAASGFKSLADVLAQARARPGKLNFGSVGTGGLEHLWVSLLGLSTGTQFTHVPFKGMPDALIALAQGELDFVPAVLPMALPYLQKGMFRPLAVLSHERVDAAAQAPSLKELGIDVAPMEFWSGLAVAAGSPSAVVERLRQATVAVMAEPAMQQQMNERGTLVVTSGHPDRFTALMQADRAWMARVIQQANIRLDA